MKYTLLELVQSVLSSIDGDEINSINDTTESQQVVAIIKRCYGNLATRVGYPEKKGFFGLTPSGTTAKPTIMYLPSTVLSVEWLKYDSKTFGQTDAYFKYVEFVPLDEFLDRMHGYVPSQDTNLQTFTHSVNGQDIQFIVRKDKAPQWYTTWDDYTFIFDSYDQAVDSTLQSSKTLGWGQQDLTWTLSDSFVIPFDDHQLILNEAIAWAWAELKQSQNVKAEREVRNQLVATQREKIAIPGYKNYQTETPNYGRK